MLDCDIEILNLGHVYSFLSSNIENAYEPCQLLPSEVQSISGTDRYWNVVSADTKGNARGNTAIDMKLDLCLYYKHILYLYMELRDGSPDSPALLRLR